MRLLASKTVPVLTALCIATSAVATEFKDSVFTAGHPSLKEWLMPNQVPHSSGNRPNAARVQLGKMLFFDPRLSGDGNMSCATCHNPAFGWSDGLPRARGFQSKMLKRATPTIVNTAYNSLQMWDGRKKNLEDQAIGPMQSKDEMNVDVAELIEFLRQTPGYKQAFAKAYPGETIDETTLAKAIASFERTVVSHESPFDKWIRGDKKAMSAAQVRGFKVFTNPEKGNCSTCHSAPNFTDNGFHNIGLASFGEDNPDVGRFGQKPIGLMKGAFKTPTLRDIALTAPYFHDGSAATLEQVIEHYSQGGEVKSNLSPNMKKLDLSDKDKADLLEFMRALTSEQEPMIIPTLPLLTEG